MKRTQLIEYGITVIGIIFGYKFLEGLFSVSIQLLFSSRNGFGDIGTIIGYGLFTIALYGIVFLFAIRKSRQIAEALNNKQPDELVPVKINKSSLLHVILIGLCMYTLLSLIPGFLMNIYDFFEQEVGRKKVTDTEYRLPASTSPLRFQIVELLFTSTVLAGSRSISRWFIPKDEVEELTFDSNSEN